MQIIWSAFYLCPTLLGRIYTCTDIVFQGEIVHTHDYKDHRGYEDKRVVVIGIGNSGGDVSVELSRIAKQV